MTHIAYLAGLVLATSGLLVIDRRWRLAFWYDARRTWRTLVPAIAVFVIWDLAGIALGIFFHGTGQYNLALTILPEFPPEELIFLFLLCYVSLLAYRGITRR